MVFAISLERLTDLRLNLWSHDVLGVVSSEELVPKVLLDLTVKNFPQFTDFVDLDNLLSHLTYVFQHRADENYFKYTVEIEGNFKGNFYVEVVPTLG